MHYTHFLFPDLNYIRSGSYRLSFIKGAEEAGHEAFRFDCALRKVFSYIVCNRCGMNGQSIFHGDFKELLPRLLHAMTLYVGCR